MPKGGSSVVTDADGYQSIIQDILDLLALQPRAFHARLTWAELPNLQLLRAKEASARLGFMRLPPDQVFVTFPTRQDSALLYGGLILRFGDLMFHALGEHRHQRTAAACEWASIATTPATLAAFGRTLFEQTLVPPKVGQIVRPRRADGRRLERLHARACHVIERNLDSISNREVVRALEQDLMWALVSCLAGGEVQEGREQNADVLPAFEALLATEPHGLLRTRDICARLGISEATLRAKCSLALGMSPGRYQRLRRLKLLRAELLRSRSSSRGTIEEIVVRYGFSNFHRFVTEYWRYYGEMPPISPLGLTDR